MYTVLGIAWWCGLINITSYSSETAAGLPACTSACMSVMGATTHHIDTSHTDGLIRFMNQTEWDEHNHPMTLSDWV